MSSDTNGKKTTGMGGDLQLFWQEKVKKFFAGDKKVRVIAVLGIAGILLILLSEFLPGGKSQESDGNTAVSVETDTAVKAQQLEQKLRSIVECIEGVGQADVMVTLQNGVEYIYAQEEKTNTDTVEDATAQTGSKVQQKNSSEQSYILIESSGEKRPVLITQLEPRVQGVVVVCDGGGNAAVVEQIIDAVTVAVDIPSTKVSVAKRQEN